MSYLPSRASLADVAQGTALFVSYIDKDGQGNSTIMKKQALVRMASENKALSNKVFGLYLLHQIFEIRNLNSKSEPIEQLSGNAVCVKDWLSVKKQGTILN